MLPAAFSIVISQRHRRLLDRVSCKATVPSCLRFLLIITVKSLQCLMRLVCHVIFRSSITVPDQAISGHLSSDW